MNYSVIHRFILIGLVGSFVACAGNLDDQYEKGLSAYKKGNYQEAFGYFYPLAQRDYPIAQEMVATIYLNHLAPYNGDRQAAYWTKRAAENGMAKAQYDYADMLHKGTGVPKDEEEAAHWLQKAAAYGDDSPVQDWDYYKRHRRWKDFFDSRCYPNYE